MSLSETWHRIEHWGEEHPVALGVGIFVVGAIIIYALIPRSSGTASGPSDAYYNAVASMAASGNQLQAAQLSYQAQSAQLQDQLTAQQNQIAGQVQLATIDQQTQLGLATISADYQSAHDKTVQESTDLASTLTAQVQSAGILAQQNIAAINASAATQSAQIASQTQLGLASYQAQTAEASYAAQAQAYQSLIGAQSHIADLNAQTQQTLAVVQGYATNTNILANAQVAAAAIGHG